MPQKNYVSLSKLSIFLDKLASKFAALKHGHKLDEIEDYKIDSALSPNSTNPVQNLVIDAEFEAVSEALRVYGIALDDKASEDHQHAIEEINDLQNVLGAINGNISNKSQIQIITWGADD